MDTGTRERGERPQRPNRYLPAAQKNRYLEGMRGFNSLGKRAGAAPSSVGTSDPKQEPFLRDPDVQLMLRVKDGDDAAFSRLVAAYQNRLLSIFFHMFRDQGGAEDLTQEVFLRIYRARNGYQPTAKFSTWLFRIANNVASNARRTLGRRREVPLNQQDSSSAPVSVSRKSMTDRSSIIPTRQAVKHETCAIVQSALETLNERQRMAVLLHKFEGMSYDDIADAMELSSEAVKSLLARARENLRSKLEPHLKSPA
jgi:RNA polymerase sigma-70 factor, ECF subfamily